MQHQQQRGKNFRQFSMIGQLNCRNFVCITFMSPSGLAAAPKKSSFYRLKAIEPKFMFSVPKKP